MTVFRSLFIDAGHILGSASIVLEVEHQGQQGKILFSGDLGYSNHAIIKTPTTQPVVDFVVMETSYGDHLHKTFEPTLEEFHPIISTSVSKGGNVIILSLNSHIE